ncbi:MAG: DUF3649 domain-containing protein [Ectothiorhodospiraceae bacterium]|nr:DUF3649 domain-containing protein [Ectothiorhodospiraceae bacterium]
MAPTTARPLATDGGRRERLTRHPAPGILSRAMAALAGGYMLSTLGGILLAAALPLNRVESLTGGLLLSYPIFTATFIWVFAARSAGRAWLGILATAVLLAPLYWMLGI